MTLTHKYYCWLAPHKSSYPYMSQSIHVYIMLLVFFKYSVMEQKQTICPTTWFPLNHNVLVSSYWVFHLTGFGSSIWLYPPFSVCAPNMILSLSLAIRMDALFPQSALLISACGRPELLVESRKRILNITESP